MNARLSPAVVRGATGALLAIVLLLAGQACAVADRQRAEPCDPAAPVASWVTRLPGTGEPVLGGVTVPTGAALIGRAFANNDGSAEALLLVTGCDPVGTFRDLVARIARARFDVTSTRPDGHLCLLRVVEPSQTLTDLPVDSTVPSGARLSALDCEASGQRSAADSGSQGGMSVEARLFIPAESPDSLWPMIRLVSPSNVRGRPTTTGVEVPSPVVALPLNQPPTSVPGEGEMADKVRVVTGSRAIAPPLDPNYGAHVGGCDGGSLTVLQVSGDAEKIHREYARQALNVYREGPEDTTFRSGPVTVLRFRVHGRRATMYIETFVEPGRPTYTRVERCTD
ncbi:hypothetical protein ACWD6L_22340 [Micromonospora profundi]|uniref:hypothetical protein n=1 Tax=Micromonospora profundi TaxID=1420889 RepID=UPI002FF12EC0